MSDSQPHITIYTDGGAEPNPGPGGWGAILIHPAKTRELSGGHPDTTNNRMELTAAIEALKALKRPCTIDFYTDSEYLRKGITQWLEKWQRTGKLAAGEVANADLWQQLQPLTTPHTITWHWVKGHAGNKFNERADQLASAAIPRRDNIAQGERTRVVMMIAGKSGNFAYAAAVVPPDEDAADTVLSGRLDDTTPNFFSIWAATQVLHQLPADEPVHFFTNNSFLFDGITKWINGWKKRGFKKFEDEWLALDALTQARQVQWVLFKKDAEPPQTAVLKETLKTAHKPGDA